MTENKMIVPFELKADDITDEGIFKGYGSVFGNKDSHFDIMMPGAFTKTLLAGGRNGTGVAMLFQHDSRRPIGVWNMLAEDKKGLRVEGQLAMKTQDGRDTFELMKIGALKGLSVGYDTKVREYDDNKKVRYLKEVELWEISPVTFGANIKATITTVKEFIKNAKTVRDVEEALRELGYSKADAQQFIAVCKEALRDSELEKEEQKDESLAMILSNLKTVNDNNQTSEILNSLRNFNS